MDKNQASKNNMYGKLLVFFATPAFAAMWVTFQVLVDDIILFVSKKKTLDKYIIQQQLSIEGITEDKDANVLASEKFTVKLARKAKVWAKKTENNTLLALFTITKSDLSKMTNTESVAKMTEILTALIANATPLLPYNITAANTTLLTNNIATAKAALSTPGAAKANTKVGTEGVESQMKDIDSTLADISDLLIAEYEDSQSDMVKTFKNDKKIDNIGHFKTKLIAACKAAITGELLENITMTIIELGKTANSTIEGIAEIEKFKAGIYHIKFTGEGYEMQTIIVKTLRGKQVEITVEMVALVTV